MATRKTVDVDINFNEASDAEYVRNLVKTYGGRIDYDCALFIGARVNKTRLSHLKGTATKKGLTVYVYEQQ